MSFELPSNDPVVGDNKHAFRTWMQWFSRVHDIVLSIQQSGPTADRPTKLLWVGRVYFDTTLGKPVWLESVRPDVWVDASGSPV